MNSLNRQLIKLFKEKLRLRKEYLKHRLNLTEENGECKMLTVLFMKLAFRSNPTGWIMQGVAKKLKNYEEFAVQKLTELEN